jgi:plastocyanin
MAVYFVLGSILVAWGLGLAILGLLREDFPPSGAAGRALVGITVVIVASTLVALLATTEREHPREEAAAEAAERKAEEQGEPGAPAEPAPGGTEGQPPSPAPAEEAGQTVKVTEKEFSIALAEGNTIQPGKTTFVVQNAGQIQHDLAIKGAGENAKTPLIQGGQSRDLKVDLNPGKYLFYCTVPGHEEAGMMVNVTVAG